MARLNPAKPGATHKARPCPLPDPAAQATLEHRALMLLLVGLIVILPMALITAALAREASGLYQRLQAGALDPMRYFRGLFDALPKVITNLLDRFGLVDFDVLQQRLPAALAQA